MTTNAASTESDDAVHVGTSPGQYQTGTGPQQAGQRDWSLSFDIELPAESWFSIHPATYDRIAALVDGEGPIFRLGPGILGVSIEFPGVDVGRAQEMARRDVAEVTSLLQLSEEAVIGVRLGAADAPMLAVAAAAGPEVPECVGVGEAAEILQVTKQRVSQLRHQPGFPPPLFNLKATPVWRRSDIERFGRGRQAVRGA